jgi:pilus assembly protein CpaF
VNAIDELAQELRKRLVAEAREGAGAPLDDRAALRERLAALISDEARPLDHAQQQTLVERVLSSALGLGPLEPLLVDPSVDEIMVNGPDMVLVERAGRIEATDVAFESEQALMHVIERVLSPLGRRVDEASPLVDARLSDGSRINCVIPPLSLNGPVLTIRRFRQRGFSAEELIASGTFTRDLKAFLTSCVQARLNLVTSGGTGSGKTTLLNVLSSMIDTGERIITIEDAAELRLRQEHVVRLESRPANLDGEGEVTIRALVRNALRMRPDRIIVGEVRGPEALDMIQALNTGHDGSMTTVHANSAADAVRRIETLALMADVALPHSAVRGQIASALDLVIHLERTTDAARRVAAVSEIMRTAGEVGVRDLYALREGVARLVAPPSDALAAKLGRAALRADARDPH